MSIREISQTNEAVKYIANRIKHPNYRGNHLSQHNRYNFDKTIKILSCLNKYIPKKQFMHIRTTDISKRPANLACERQYAQFCEEAKEISGIGTQDAMRKNLFVDFHRMGFIERFDKNKNLLNPYEGKSVSYIRLSDLGLSLIDSKNIKNKYFIFAKGLDNVFNGIIANLIDILRSCKKLSIYEFMFFVTAIDIAKSKFPFSLTQEKAIRLIRIFNSLSRIQKKSLIEQVKKELNPKNYDGNKVDKKDFHNWKNESQQILTLLRETPYFEIRDENISLSTDKDFKDVLIKRLNRSLDEKQLYLQKHEITQQIKGFELHHIVPLSWSESIGHFKLLDKWKNMLYIDGFSHAKITQNQNRNVILSAQNSDLILSDFQSDKVVLKIDKNVAYLKSLQKIMLDYNDELLKTH
jgi:hypothetical protein